MKIISIKTNAKEELTNITAKIKKTIDTSKIKSGLCTIFVMHTTAGITINENADPDVMRDILYGLNKIVPESGYHHAEGNSSAHIKASLLGSSVSIIVEDGKLTLGTWQGIYFGEFDGPRERQVLVKVIPS